MTAIKRVKAFIVETDDPDETVIAFATSNVAARRQGADEIGTDFGSVSCRRLPWADEYAGKGIPAEAYIQHGWRVSCTNCGYMVSQDSYTMDESGEEIPHNPVYCGEHVYCCPDCKSAHEAVSKEQAVLLWYEGFRSEPIPVLEAWEAIGHDIGCNPSKQELLDSLRNMAAICEAHGNDMPKPAQHARDSAELRRLCSERDALRQQLAERDAQIERLQMQLAACGVVALANTPGSAGEARQMHPDYMSASCSDVADAVDREIAMRQQRDNIAQILRDLVPGCKWRIMRPRIDAALAEIDNADE